MSDDQYEVRRRRGDETESFLQGEQARRRRRRPSLEEIDPAQVPARLETIGPRGRLAGVRVAVSDYAWRWPWPTSEHLDVVGCDLEGVSIEARLLRGSKVDDCTFEQVGMGGARIGGTTFTGCTFNRVSLAGIATAEVRNSTFRGSSFTRFDVRGARFDRVTFEDCEIDGLRGQATTFKGCSFIRTRFRGQITGIVLDRCSFDEVDMSEALMSRAFMVDSRTQRQFILPAHRSGFVIDYKAFLQAAEDAATSISGADAALLRREVGWRANNPPAELVIDDDTFAELSPDGRDKATDAMFERRLVRRG
jgi:uncharacterized protein YjbI with pentapeptide repeats